MPPHEIEILPTYLKDVITLDLKQVLTNKFNVL